jgi:hypothetical protein
MRALVNGLLLQSRRGSMAVIRSRSCIAIALVAIGCGSAGELHPFASGPGGGAADGSGGEVPGAETTSGDGADADGGTAGAADTWDGELDFVYVRCRRTTQTVTVSLEIEKAGEVMQAERTLGYADVYDRLPSAQRMHGSHVAPCDLMYRAGDGSEEILYDCGSISDGESACAALDPAVSHDGRYVAFSVARGSVSHSEMKARPALVDPEADGGEERWYDLPNPGLDVVDAQLFVYDLEQGELTALPHEEGVLDVTPAFLSTGRIAFASSRAGTAGTVAHYPGSTWNTTSTTARTLQLHAMDPSGRDVARISPHAMTLDAHPFQLADGRIAHASWQAFGMLPYRYDNGSWGTPGAIGAGVHLQAIGPWGTHLSPLFGQHTHISHGAQYPHLAAQRITQSEQGTIWFTDAGGSSGAGAIYAFASPAVDLEGPAPAEVENAGDVFRPADLFAAVPWAGRGTNFAGTVPDPPVELPGYADPLLYAGFVRDPEALPGGALALSWTKGGCSEVGARHEDVFGDAEPPLTSGSGAFTAMNVMAWSGLDTPGCDAGIYVASTIPVEHPSALEAVVDTVEFHEIMPRAAIPYSAVHGVEAPAQPEPDVAELEPGSPFGEIAVSSMLLRETRSADGHPFNGLLQWATQGTDTADYDDAEVCGVRLLAVQPNPVDDSTPPRSSTGHRMLVLGELPVRRPEGVVDPLGMPDTSFRARVPADVPLVIQGIDCEGRTLNTSQTPFSLRPGERLVCTGCHQRSAPGLEFDGVAAALESTTATLLGGGSVQLLAGEEDGQVVTRAIDGWGLAFEFERDVLPILEQRCTPCHESAAPEAGLALDIAGVDAGSTWWTLAADTTQTYVPAELRAPSRDDAGPLRKPQLSKYVRFMSARGSLLYWKTIDARTDGRTDGQFGADASFGFEDVDFGPEHPTDVTPEEAGVISRWIDAGAAATEPVLQDTTPPTLTAAALGQGAERRLAIGTVDVGSGIDPTSLELCLVEPGGGCTIVPAPPANEAGTVEVVTPDVAEEREIRISVRDHAGNETSLVRTVHALAGAFNQGAPGAHHDDGASESGSSGPEGDGDGDALGCGCVLAPARPAPLGLLVLLFARRRRPSR